MLIAPLKKLSRRKTKTYMSNSKKKVYFELFPVFTGGFCTSRYRPYWLITAIHNCLEFCKETFSTPSQCFLPSFTLHLHHYIS